MLTALPTVVVSHMCVSRSPDRLPFLIHTHTLPFLIHTHTSSAHKHKASTKRDVCGSFGKNRTHMDTLGQNINTLSVVLKAATYQGIYITHTHTHTQAVDKVIHIRFQTASLFPLPSYVHTQLQTQTHTHIHTHLT